MNDLRFAFRQLLKSPGFTAVAVRTLAQDQASVAKLMGDWQSRLKARKQTP